MLARLDYDPVHDDDDDDDDTDDEDDNNAIPK